VNGEDGVGIAAVEEARLPDEVGDLLCAPDRLRDHEQDGVDGLEAVRRAPLLHRRPLRFEEAHGVLELRERLLPAIVLPPHEHRRLHELVRDRGGERVAVDDLLARRLLVRRRREPDERVRPERADRVRERGAVVDVVLVCEQKEIAERLQVRVELVAERLVEGVHALPLLPRRPDERLDREDVQLDAVGLGVVDGREVLGGDDQRLDLHPGEQALRVPRREVRDRLLEDRPPRRDDGEVAVAALGEVLDRDRDDVRLADAGRRVDDGLERRRPSLDVVVLRKRVREGAERFAVRLAQVEPRRDRVDRGVVDVERPRRRCELGHAGARSASGSAGA
jgi:hypothetical protein